MSDSSTSNKIIAFYVRSMDPTKKPFVGSDEARHDFGYSYQQHLMAFRRAGAQAYFVSGNDTYLGGGRFSNAWSIEEAKHSPEFTEVGPITADLVFEKGGFEGRDVLIVTDPRLQDICDKVETYRRFGRYQPQSVIVENDEELKVAIADMPGEIVVVKKPTGSSGHHVYIAPKSELVVPEHEGFPLLVQEFMDLSEGVPGLAPGAHDLRIIMAGSTIVGGTVRQPVEGRYHANTSQGGSLKLIKANEIPAEAVALAHQIDNELKDFPRYYGLDFARSKQGWKLIELNHKPGLYFLDVGPLAEENMNQLAKYLVSLL